MLSFFNTSLELIESGCDTAVLPMGSVEPKGPHLPVGFDLILADRFSRDFSRNKNVYLLPVFPFSSAQETLGFAGTVSLRQQTLCSVLQDIAGVLHRHNFKRLVVLDFSLYNWVLKPTVREINLDTGGIQAVWIKPKEFARESLSTEFLPDHGGGSLETALALFLNEELVRPPLKDLSPETPREMIDYGGLKSVVGEGYWGKPSLATVSLGKRLYRLMLTESLEFVDSALGLFSGGGPLQEHGGEELWWPDDALPGTAPPALSWRATLSELNKAGDLPIFLVTGALEQHSRALPLGTDYLYAVEFGRRVVQQMGGYLLPPLAFMTSWSHIHFRGTVSLRSMTVRRVIEDVADSLAAGGSRRIVLLNTHGGNWVLKPTMVEINRRHDNLTVVSAEDLLPQRGQKTVDSLHAHEAEASFIRAFFPESLKESLIEDYSPRVPASFLDLVGMRGVSPRGVWGYPSRHSEDRGRADLKARVEKAAGAVQRILKGLKNS
jgi:creatinine amidohydrolase